MTMRYSIRTLVVTFLLASLTLMGQQQQPAARGGQAGGARGQGANGGRGATPRGSPGRRPRFQPAQSFWKPASSATSSCS